MRSIFRTIFGATLLVGTAAKAEVDGFEPRSAIEVLAPMVLNGYSRFPRNIASAPVYDVAGHRIGLVQKLEADPAGKPAAIEIWLPTGPKLTVVASNISYDEQQNIITAGVTDTQVGFKPSGAR